MVNVQIGTEGVAQGIPSWPSAVTSADGSIRWLSLYDACDGASLRVRFGGAGDAPFVDAARGRSAAGGARCAGSHPPAGAGALRAGRKPVAAGDDSARLGSGGARSVDGRGTRRQWPPTSRRRARSAAWGRSVRTCMPVRPAPPMGARSHAEPSSVFSVRTPKAWQMWRPADLEGAYAYADLRGCTAANDARAVACVRSGRLIAMLAPAAP